MRRRQCVAQVVSLALITVCALAAPALAQDCPELVGRMPGGISAVAVSGDYAYLGTESALFIADVSSPSAPRRVGEVGLPGRPADIAVSGGYAYVAWHTWYANQGGLRVVDVSTPSAPVEVGFVDTPGEALGVAVVGGYAYVASHGYLTNQGRLRVVDVSTPSNPVEVGFLDTPGPLEDVEVSGGYAYVADGDAGLRVIDVSTPSAPVEIGFVETQGGASDVAVSGGYAYVTAGGHGGLHVIDVSTPSAPVEVGFLEGIFGRVAIEGSYAYVVSSDLRVIDVSTPSTPVEVGFVNTPGFAHVVAVSGGYAYVGDRYAGLRVIDVSTPSAPLEVGTVASLPQTGAVAASGGYAYVAASGAWGGGLRVVDISTPSAPVEVGSVMVDFLSFHRRADAEVLGQYVYVVGYFHSSIGAHSDLAVIDVSTPSAPELAGSLHWWGESIGSIAVSDDYAYVVGRGLWVIDVSTPSAPAEVGFLETGHASGVAVSGEYAYVAAGDAGLRVIDVSTPTGPVEVGFVATDIWGDVAVEGGYAYATSWDGLHVIDVSTPSAPVEVGFVEIPAGALEVSVGDGYAYVIASPWYAGNDRSLRVIEVSTPFAPVEVGFHEVPIGEGELDWGGGLAVSDGSVFFAAGDGLYIFDECDPLADARECFIPAAAVAAGAQGAFFQTDVEVNNTGPEEAQVSFQWLPRGEDNSVPAESEPIALAAGHSLRYENVLTELFGLEPDSLGALKMVASTESVIGMSRTYNIPAGETVGTFGQGLPAVRATEMIKRTERRRIIFLSEDFSSRANVGCVNGSSESVTINIELFNPEGESLEVKTMNLGPYSNNQINHVFQGHLMGNGYVDVWADSIDAIYYCYGSMLDNVTSDPTTILPQVPSDEMTFIPATALSAGLEGAFFRTDLDLNNVGSTPLTYELLWLPRGEDNTAAVHSDPFSLAPGAGVRYGNVLGSVFGLEPDQVGALAIEASGIDLLAMSRTYNLPSAKVAGTFGQELPGIPADRMITTGERKRIIFMNENDDIRSNVGCINGAGIEVAVAIELYDSDGVKLETKYMMLPPYSNRQINGIFQDHAPINGYVDVRTYTPDALIYCYGSVLDNLTSDPTTVLPQ